MIGMDDYLRRLEQACDQVDRAADGLGGFDWQPGWTPTPLIDTLPASVYPPYTELRPQPDTATDRASALIDALIGVDLGPVDGHVIAWLATEAGTPVTATIVSLIHRARLAGEIPGRARPAPTSTR